MTAIDLWALGLVFIFLPLCYLLYRWHQKIPGPEILFSNTTSLPTYKPIKKFWLRLPFYLEATAFALLLLAFLDPHFLIEKKIKNSTEPISIASTEGIAVYFVLDRSGSMGEKVEGLTKIDRLKTVVTDFIKANQGNMIGLVAFARGAQVLSPLTLDQKSLEQKISQLSATHEENQDGTAIGYGIYKAANLIAATKHYAQELIQEGTPAYDIKDTVMILVTDGIQDPNPLDQDNPLRNMDIPEAASYAKNEGIRLYIVNVEPRLGQEQFTPHRNQMQKAAESTGGRFFLVATPDSLKDIINQIDSLEKTRFPSQVELLKTRKNTPFLYRRIDLYPYLIAIALSMLSIAILLQTTWLRRVP